MRYFTPYMKKKDLEESGIHQNEGEGERSQGQGRQRGRPPSPCPIRVEAADHGLN